MCVLDILLSFKKFNDLAKKTDLIFHFAKPNIPIHHKLIQKKSKKKNSLKGTMIYLTLSDKRKLKLDLEGVIPKTEFIIFKKMFKKLKKMKKSLKNSLYQLTTKNTFMGKVFFTFSSKQSLIFVNNIPKEIVMLMLKKIKSGKRDIKLEDCFRSTVLKLEVVQIVEQLVKNKEIEHHFKNIDMTIEVCYSKKGELKQFNIILDPDIFIKLEDSVEFSRKSSILENQDSLFQLNRLKRAKAKKKRGLCLQNEFNQLMPMYKPESSSELNEFKTPENVSSNFLKKMHSDYIKENMNSANESNGGIDGLSRKSSKSISFAKSSLLRSKTINKPKIDRKQTFSHFKSAMDNGLEAEHDKKINDFKKSYAMEFLPEEDESKDNSNKKERSRFYRTRTMKMARSVTINRKSTINNMNNINVEIQDFDIDCTYKELIKLEETLCDDILLDWQFSALKYNKQEKYAILYKIFKPYLTELKINVTTFSAFLTKVEFLYSRNKNPFHNFDHGVMVCQASNVFLNKMECFNKLLTPNMRFAFILSALGHDLDHTGRNNNFEINSGSRLALRYSDRSPLEFHHIYRLFSILNEDDTNLFNNFIVEDFKHLREFIIEIILATDMKYHFNHIEHVKNLIDENSTFDSKEELFVLSGLILHTADLSAPTKNMDVALDWSKLVVEEFSAQYKDEERLNIPLTPYFKDLHLDINFNKGEKNFITFIIRPLYETVELFVDSCYDEDDDEAEGEFDKKFIKDIVKQTASNEQYYQKVINHLISVSIDEPISKKATK